MIICYIWIMSLLICNQILPGSRFSLPSDKVEKIEPEKTEQEKRIEQTVNKMPFSSVRMIHTRSTSKDFPMAEGECDLSPGIQYFRECVRKRYEEHQASNKEIDTKIAPPRVFERMPTVNPRRVRVKPRVQPVE